MNLAALKSQSYRRYYIGSAMAVNGMWILRIVLAWLAWDITKSATFVGFISSLTLIPTMVSGPLFGVLMDRVNIIRAAYSTNWAMMSVAAAILIAVTMEGISKPFLTVIGLYMGLITSAHHPMRLSIGPRLVKRENINSVSALAALNFNVARVLSPAIAGFLIDGFGIRTALCVTLVLYVPNLFLLRTLNPRAIQTTKAYSGFWNSLREGFSYIYHNKKLRLILMAVTVMALSIRSIFEILPVIADGEFGRGAVGLGQLGSAVGGGALIAAFAKALGTSKNVIALSGRNLSIGAVGILATGILASTTIWPMALLSAGVMGISATYVAVGIQAEIQSELPDDIRGRVMSLWGVVALGSVALGALLVGWLADVVGLRATGVGVCGMALVALGWIYWRFRMLGQSN